MTDVSLATDVQAVGQPRSRLLLGVVAVGVAAAAISLFRLWLGNHAALTEVVWAEDGLFPLCVRKADFVACLSDPFAGYLLLLPRLFAGVTALLPVESWALATNLMAALTAGVVAGWAFLILRRFGVGIAAGTAVALLPVLAPIVGLEALNALGSSYMLLLFLSVLNVALLPDPFPRGGAYVIVGAALLLLTALTIPTAGMVLGLIGVQALRHKLPLRAWLTWSLVTAFGLVGQWVAATNAAQPRSLAVSSDSVHRWADTVPQTILTYVPGLQMGSYKPYDMFTPAPSGWIGPLVVAVLVIIGLFALSRGSMRRSDRTVAVGLLVLSGVVVGAVPSLIGAPNNRYFVVPMLLWGAALLVAIDPWLTRHKPWMAGVAAAAILLLWWPVMPASQYRSTPAPPWTGEVARIKAACKAQPERLERLVVSPFWPLNWGDDQSEPTHPNIPCLTVWKWM